MKYMSELFGYVLIGGVLGFIIRLVIYVIYKTPAIEFDGPAAASFALAVIAGGLIFALMGAFDIKRDNKRNS